MGYDWIGILACCSCYRFIQLRFVGPLANLAFRTVFWSVVFVSAELVHLIGQTLIRLQENLNTKQTWLLDWFFLTCQKLLLSHNRAKVVLTLNRQSPFGKAVFWLKGAGDSVDAVVVALVWDGGRGVDVKEGVRRVSHSLLLTALRTTSSLGLRVEDSRKKKEKKRGDCG